MKTWKIIIAWICFWLFAATHANAQTGWLVRADCGTLTAVNDNTVCLQSTTASGRTPGIYVYTGGAWQLQGGGGGGPVDFSQIQTGTNTSSAFTVGSGSSLTISGSGTNNANRWNGSSTINLASHVAGNLSVNNLNSGTNASIDTVWRGNGTWGSFVESVVPGNGIGVSIASPRLPNVSVVGQMSVAVDVNGVKLTNDTASPGNSKCYSTNGSGTRGWYDCAAGASTTPGGSNTQFQYNNSGAFAGSALLTTNGSTVTLGDASSKALLFSFTNASAGDTTVNVPSSSGGTVTIVKGIANPSDSNCVTYIDAAGVQQRSACGGTLADDSVTNAKLANMANATIKCRTTAGTGDPEDCTGTQVTALLDTFSSSAKGLTPASGGGTSNFLRADGNWAAPSGGGNVTTGTLTTGAIPKATGATSIADSSLFDCGSGVFSIGSCSGAATGMLSTSGAQFSTKAAPTAPAAGIVEVWGDSTANQIQAKDSSGNVNTTVRVAGSATANQFVTHIPSTGIPATAQPAFSNLSGTASDAQIPHLNTLSTGLTANRCVETAGDGTLTVAAATCGTGGGGAGTPPRVTFAYSNAVQAVTANTSTVVALPLETYDDGGWHDTVTNNSRITISSAQVCNVNGTIAYTPSSGDGLQQVGFLINNSIGPFFYDSVSAPGTTTVVANASFAYKFAANDYIELVARSTVNADIVSNGGSLSVICGGTSASITVAEVDGSPSVANVTTLRVSNGTLTDDGSGQVTITTGGGGGGTSVKQIFIPAIALIPDGTNCLYPSTRTINSGHQVESIRCADSGSSVVRYSLRMPSTWDAGTVTVTPTVLHGTTETITWAMDFATACRRPADTWNNTYGTAQSANVSITTANQTAEQTTAAITADGTCAAGAMLLIRGTVDATDMSANGANTDLLGITVNATY